MLWENEQDMQVEAALLDTKIEELDSFFDKFSKQLFGEERAFYKFMRRKFKEKQISQKEVFEKASISIRYGYKLISGEKKTAQRDVIIRLCLSLHMTVYETQRALILGGFSELQIYVKRDVLLMALINNEIFNIATVNEYLTKYNEEKLYEGKKGEYEG